MEEKNPARLTVATYNVLADAYAKPEYFPHFAPESLAADVRYPRVVERVVGLAADVLCLQEVDYRLFRMLTMALVPFGYRGRWAHKDGTKPDGVATFVRSPWLVGESRIGPLGDRHEDGAGGHVALVAHIHSDAVSCVIANAHLKWDAPDKPGLSHAGFRQAQRLLAALADERPTVVCGDFNAEPTTALLRLFLVDAGFVDTHPDGAPTCSHLQGVNRIDYILARQPGWYRPVYADAHHVSPISDVVPAPSLAEPSDHVPVVTTFVF